MLTPNRPPSTYSACNKVSRSRPWTLFDHSSCSIFPSFFQITPTASKVLLKSSFSIPFLSQSRGISVPLGNRGGGDGGIFLSICFRPSLFPRLSSIERIYLGCNQFTGPFPNISGMPLALKAFGAVGNALTTPTRVMSAFRRHSYPDISTHTLTTIKAKEPAQRITPTLTVVLDC